MAPLPRAQQVIAARLYAQRADIIRRRLAGAALLEFDRLDADWTQLPWEYVEHMSTLSEAAQRALARELAGYLYVSSGADYEPLDLDEVSGDAIRPEGEQRNWAIPFFSFFGAIGAGVVVAEALGELRRDIEYKAQTDLALAQRETMQTLAPRLEGIRGFRRVLDSSEVDCAFCSEAADQVYRTYDLMPLHPNCQCSVAPVYDDADPGASINEELNA